MLKRRAPKEAKWPENPQTNLQTHMQRQKVTAQGMNRKEKRGRETDSETQGSTVCIYICACIWLERER